MFLEIIPEGVCGLIFLVVGPGMIVFGLFELLAANKFDQFFVELRRRLDHDIEKMEERMTKKILVAYESKYGATQAIAEKIASVNESGDIEVSLAEAGNVRDIVDFEAVVLGSAVYYGRWRKGAVKFLKRHEAQLTKVPVWLFSSGPIGEGAPVELP